MLFTYSYECNVVKRSCAFLSVLLQISILISEQGAAAVLESNSIDIINIINIESSRLFVRVADRASKRSLQNADNMVGKHQLAEGLT